MRFGLATSSVFALALSSALLIPSHSEAGPWVDQAPGHGYISLGFSDYEASEYLAGPCAGSCAGSPASGGFKPAHQNYGQQYAIKIPELSQGVFSNTINSDYKNRSMQFYGEVSLWKGLGFVASMPLVSQIEQATDAASLKNTAVGDLVTGLKYQIPTSAKLKGFAFGPQLYMTWPTGDVNARGVYPGMYKQYNNPLPIPSGNGTYDIEARLSAGYSFYPIPIFVIGEVGYHHHWDAATCTGIPNEADPKNPLTQHVTYSDDLPWTVQVGGTYEPKKKVNGFDHLTLIGYVHGTKSFENGFIDKSGTAAYERPCGQSNNMTYEAAGGQIMIYFIKWFGVTYSVEHVLAGGNVGYGLTQTAGLAASF